MIFFLFDANLKHIVVKIQHIVSLCMFASKKLIKTRVEIFSK